MSVKNLAAAGLALFALGGVVLAGAIAPSLGLIASLGLGGLVLGSSLVSAVLLRSFQIQQTELRIQSEGARDLAERLAVLDAGQGAEDPGPATSAQVAQVTTAVREALAAQRRELLQVVDARVLGIHETVRDLRGGAS